MSNARPVHCDQILRELAAERVRQELLVESGKHDMSCAHPLKRNCERLGVLMEEVGEVARAINDGEPTGNLRAELVQVAAVCVSWVEAIDGERARATEISREENPRVAQVMRELEQERAKSAALSAECERWVARMRKLETRIARGVALLNGEDIDG